jgi:formylglycine-generating enzyme required for sulfatase activity
MSNTVRLGAALAGAAVLSYVAFAYGPALFKGGPTGDPPGMVWISGGEFTMGTDSEPAWPDERPAHRVRVNGFWMDETDVTNGQFGAFVEATGYVTTAEKPVDADRSCATPRTAGATGPAPGTAARPTPACRTSASAA